MARHVGQHVKSGDHLIVHFMLIPEQTENALVTETAKVPEPMRSTLLRALQELQGPEDLAQSLSRRMYADTNKSILQVLHESGHLKGVPVDDIVMTPDGNHRIPLRHVLQQVGKLPTDPGLSADMNPASKFNPHLYNAVATTNENTLQKAQNLLAEAELLQADANARRAQAYSLAPQLNPAVNLSGTSTGDQTLELTDPVTPPTTDTDGESA